MLLSSLWKGTNTLKVSGAEENMGDSAEKVLSGCIGICLQESEDQTRVCLHELPCLPVRVCHPVMNCKQLRAHCLDWNRGSSPK